MRYKARLRKEYPRSLIQLTGTTIRAGAVHNYRRTRIYYLSTDKLSQRCRIKNYSFCSIYNT